MVRVQGSANHLPVKRGYQKHAAKLDGALYDCEHYIVPAWDGEVPVHVAVAVLPTGEYAIGTAVPSPLDQYSRRRGHEIAVGRALKALLQPGVKPKFEGPLKKQIELRDECRPIAEAAAEEATNRAYRVWCKKGI